MVKKKATTAPQLTYTARLKALGRIYTSDGKDAAQAISGLTPGIIRGSVILSVEKGDSKKERILPAINALRLFNARGVTREIAIKNTAALFANV